MSGARGPAFRAALLELMAESFRGSERVARVRARGISMEPLIREDDEVELRYVTAGELKLGDIAAIRSGENLIVHRIVGVWERPDGRRLIEKGDNALAFGTLTDDQVLGRVEAIWTPGGGRIDLTRAPWPALGRVLARYGRVSVRLFARLRGPAGAGGASPGPVPPLAAALGVLLKAPQRALLALARLCLR